MSLEDALKENTAASTKLTAAINQLCAGMAINQGLADVRNARNAGTTAAAQTRQAGATPDKGKQTGAGTTGGSAATPTAADKKVVSSLVLKLVADGQRDKVKAILAKFGAAKVPELKDEKAVKGAHKLLLALEAEVAAAKKKAEEGSDTPEDETDELDDLDGGAGGDEEELDDLDDLE